MTMLSLTQEERQASAHSHCAVAIGCLAFERAWAMPSADTFSIPVIGAWVKKYLQASKTSIDPFARNKRWATHTNDLNPETEAEHHMEARAFMEMLIAQGVKADLIIFDPPYSPRQISECYAGVGMTVGMKETQSAVLYMECRSLINQLAEPGCKVLSFGWNSTGMGGCWTRGETLLVCHGGAHNDTICVCDHLMVKQDELLWPDNTQLTDAKRSV